MKSSVTAYQNGYFYNVAIMYGCMLCTIGPCVKVFEFGRKSQLCHLLTHISYFKWLWELHLHFSQGKLVGLTLRQCLETNESTHVYTFWTIRELAWSTPLSYLTGQMFPENILDYLESHDSIHVGSEIWVQEQKEIPETPQMWLLILLVELSYSLVPSLFSIVYLKKG